MRLGLRPRRIRLQHDRRRRVRVRLCVLPALHRRPHKAHHLVAESCILQVRLQHVKPVFQRRHALVFVFERHQIIRLDPRLQHLTIFVIGHRRNAGRLLLQQRIDVEALLQHRHPIRTACRRQLQLAHPRQERIFVAIEPHAQRLALEIRRRRHARFLQTGQHQPRMLERLRDIDQRHALFPRRQRGRHPIDDHIRPAARDHLFRRNIWPARHDRHVQPFVLVIAFRGRDIVPGKLRLRHPFQLQLHAVRRPGARGHQPHSHRSRHQFQHRLTSMLRLSQRCAQGVCRPCLRHQCAISPAPQPRFGPNGEIAARNPPLSGPAPRSGQGSRFWPGARRNRCGQGSPSLRPKSRHASPLR